MSYDESIAPWKNGNNVKPTTFKRRELEVDTAAEVAKPIIPAQLDQLCGKLEFLEKLMVELQCRLVCVLSPEQPEQAGKNGVPGDKVSAMAEQIQNLHAHADHLCNLERDILNRLQL